MSLLRSSRGPLIDGLIVMVVLAVGALIIVWILKTMGIDLRKVLLGLVAIGAAVAIITYIVRLFMRA